MSSFPRIYSISTVGIRQHDNADYLLHPVRTDFTGNNGLGKSIIADLLQLIFVPIRDEWKPGTEGLDKEKRKVETIPLERDWIQHAYCFLNIEKEKGKFITIGVFIPRTSRLPLRPFIIQKGDDFENKKISLKPFEQVLTSADFIAENLHIYDLTELKRHLHKKYQIYFKDFYQREQINDYFDLLFKNQIIPFDLTKESNLKSFAKVLQSFSRAKTLDINKSKSLQDFLFEDNENIKTIFDTQKETLSQHIRNFHRADIEIRTLEEKQNRLSKLKITHNRFVVTKEDYLTKNTHYLFGKFKESEKIFKDNENKQNKAFEEYSIARRDFESQSRQSYSKLIEQKEVCNEIRIHLDDQQAESGKQNLDTLKAQLQKNNSFLEKLDRLYPIVKDFKTTSDIANKFTEQDIYREQKKKLVQLESIETYGQFKNSKWSENYDQAYEYYNTRSQIIEISLKTLKEVLSLYDGNNPDSLFNWVIKQNKELTIEEETVLMNFKEIFTRQISSAEGIKFTLNPKTLFSSYEKEGNGIWINLGSISEFFPLVSKQIFNDKSKLKQAIENNREEISTEIRNIEREKVEIKKLNNDLISIGYNQNYCEVYLNRKSVNEYELIKIFTEDNLNFIIENFNLFEKIEILKNELKELDEKITTIISKTAVIDNEFKQNKKVLDEILIEITALKNEITNPVDIIELGLKNFLKDKLVKLRDDNEKEIKANDKTRNNTRRRRDEQLNMYNSCKSNYNALKTEKERFELNYKEAKRNLEEETDLKFDNLLALGDITEDGVESLKLEYENAQRIFEQEFMSVAGSFHESKPESKRPEIYTPNGLPNYSFQTLVNVLCGKIGIEGLTKELSDLNHTLITLGDLQLKILTEVFSLVEKQYKEHLDTVRRLNFFFEKNKVSDVFQFRVEFNPRTDINIDWIEKMKNKARVHKLGPDLFTSSEDLPSNENTPENLIKNIAKTFYHSVNADPSDLLDPKFYFTLKVSMKDEEGKLNSGSGGQAYTALALLCIGRLSIVQKHQEQYKGVKFIIIEELSNIDDTNFSIFPEIAKQFGYQLMTMTPKPFGSYTNEDWYLHMLVKGKQDKHRNYTPMSFFKTKFKKMDLYTYIKEQDELENNKRV